MTPQEQLEQAAERIADEILHKIHWWLTHYATPVKPNELLENENYKKAIAKHFILADPYLQSLLPTEQQGMKTAS